MKKPVRRDYHYFRELDFHWFREGILPPEFKVFVEHEIWPKLTPLHRGYKTERRRIMAAHCIRNLIGTGLTGKVVADGRRKARQRIPIWAAVKKAGFCRVCTGSELSGRVTLYRATPSLLHLRELWELRLLESLDLRRNTELGTPTSHALVILYSGKADYLGRPLPPEEQKKPLSLRECIEAACPKDASGKPDPQAVQNGLDYFQAVENEINAINAENLRHSWLAYHPDGIAFQPNVCLRQVHSGQLFRATRLYSWGALSGQSMSKAQRQAILIDGEPSQEIDSHCHAIRMVYHLSGIDERGDVYWPERIFRNYYNFPNVAPDARSILRAFVKIGTNVALNTRNRSQAIAAIAAHLRKHKEKEYAFLNNAIWKVEKLDLNGLLDRIVQVHPPKVAERFFKDHGAELMTIDGKIMFTFLREFVVERKKPALAIHDGLLVRVSDVWDAMQVYSEIYRQYLQFKPVLR